MSDETTDGFTSGEEPGSVMATLAAPTAGTETTLAAVADPTKGPDPTKGAEPRNYDAVENGLESIEAPLYAVPGNHDGPKDGEHETPSVDEVGR